MGDGPYFEGPVTISPKSDEPKELLAAYLEWLTGECHNLPLGLIDIRFVDAVGKQSVTLTDVYVDLDVVAPAEDDKQPGKGKTPSAHEVRTWALQLVRGEGGGGRTSLLDVLSDPKSSHIVLLGEAGSGKTTFVNYLAYLLASGSADTPTALRGLLPVRLTLRDVAARHMPGAAAHGEAQWIWEALRADIAACLGNDVAEELLPYLRKRLLAEGGCFLFDGLDEVPTAGGRRERLLEAVESFMRPFEKTRTRFIVTARPYAYADPRARLPRTRTLALAPFSEKQVGRFIARFYQAVRPAMSWNAETAHGKGEMLRTALAERPYLGDLASRPLLLTLMATLNASWGRLPEDRADLYEETVQLLLSRWKNDIATLGIPEERMRPALEALAFAVHERQGSQPKRDDAPADISRTELVVAFEPLLGVLKTEDLIGFLRQRAGLLIEHDDGIFGFPHRSFQEYLAGCRLANQQDAATRLRKLAQTDVTWWREVCLLAIGKQWRGSHGGAANLVQALIPESPDEEAAITDQHWRLAALAGQALVELRPNERGGQEDFAVLFRRSQRWLTRLVEEGRLTARERADVGDLLGRLADPRFDVSSLCLPCRYRGQAEATYGFVEIAPGPFVMGSKKGDKDAYDDEYGNPAQLTIPYRYWIARYPVTVAQYGSFLADHGCDEDAPWWTATGRAWRRGEWDSQVTEDWLKERLKERSPDLRAMPMWWGEQASYPNRPVMGVSWFEAVAYCRWLDARLRSRVNWIPDSHSVRLPTEAEWEKAARAGDARRFPWGDEPWDENRANIEQNVGHASAVGSFPAGATPSGIHDLSGNVWEWTASLYKPYPYRADDGRNDPDAAGSRVVRGGSWGVVRGTPAAPSVAGTSLTTSTRRRRFSGSCVPIGFWFLIFWLLLNAGLLAFWGKGPAACGRQGGEGGKAPSQGVKSGRSNLGHEGTAPQTARGAGEHEERAGDAPPYPLSTAKHRSGRA